MSSTEKKDYYKFDYVEGGNQQPMLQSTEIDCGPTLTLDDVRQESRLVMKRLISVTCVSCTFMVCELIGGWLSNSLAILTDAAHLLSDVSGFIISIFSIWVGLIPAKKSSLSYGYHRAEIIGALTSVLIIWALTAWLVIEAVDRVINPSPVDGLIMTITSIIGLCCNLVMGLILNTNICGKIEIEPRISKMSRMKKEEEQLMEKKKTMELEGKTVNLEQVRKTENPNLRAAVIHILGDTIQSLGVILAAVIILNNPDAIVADPICTFVFSIIVLFTTVGVATECIRCMMEAVPVGMNIIQLEDDINKLPGLKDCHDLHVWSLTTGKVSLSAHMTSEDPTLTLIECNKLFARYGIYHSTVQVENWADRKRYNCSHLKTNLIHE